MSKLNLYIFYVNLIVLFSVLFYSILLILIHQAFGEWSNLVAFILFLGVLTYIFFMLPLENKDKKEEDDK